MSENDAADKKAMSCELLSTMRNQQQLVEFPISNAGNPETSR